MPIEYLILRVKSYFQLQALLLKAFLDIYFLRSAAPATAITLAIWFFVICTFHGSAIFKSLKNNKAGLLTSLILAALVFSTIRIGFRVLSDETNLLGVSRSIATQMTSTNDLQGVYLPDGQYRLFEYEIPTRPVMFPFMVALLHWCFGISASNMYILNFVLFVALLWTFYIVLEDRKPWIRVCSTALLALNASLALHVASGGFDLCSLLFGLWTFIFLYKYLKSREEKYFFGLICTILVFIQIRYESIMYVPIILATVLIANKQDVIKILRNYKVIWLLPLLMIPYFMQRYLTWGRFENRPDEAAFSLANIPRHAPVFLQQFFLEFKDVYPVVCNVLGIIAVVYLFKKNKSNLFLKSCLATGGVLLALLLSHHMGIASSATQIRLFMPLSVMLLFALAFALPQGRRTMVILIPITLFQMYWGYHYLKANADFEGLPKETSMIQEYLTKHPNKQTLFVYRRPGQFISQGYSAVHPKFFLRNYNKVMQLKSEQAIQSIYEVNENWHFGEDPPISYPGWRRVPVTALPLSAFSHLQIDELVPVPKGLLNFE